MATYITIIGLAIFVIYLLQSGQNKSLEITMQLGLAMAFLGLAINFSLSPILQLGVIIATALLLLQKGFV